MSLSDALNQEAVSMQQQLTEKVGQGVRILLLNEGGEFTDGAFVTKAINVIGVKANGNDVVYQVSATPMGGQDAPVPFEFTEIVTVNAGFRLIGKAQIWEVRTAQHLTPYVRNLLGLKD